MAEPAPARAPRRLEATALVLGDHVNADVLHPSRYFSLDDGKVASGFLAALPGDAPRPDGPRIVVAGRNFGCGSSRETTVRSFALAGVRAVVAVSFGRIFFRNLLATGIDAYELAAPATDVATGDAVTLDRDASRLVVNRTGEHHALRARDPFLDDVVAAGGLLEWLETDGEAP